MDWQPMEWQPIESAPRDGTPILACVSIYSSRTKKFICWQIDVVFCVVETGEIHIDCDRGFDLDDYEYWMFAPTPPKGGE